MSKFDKNITDFLNREQPSSIDAVILLVEPQNLHAKEWLPEYKPVLDYVTNEELVTKEIRNSAIYAKSLTRAHINYIASLDCVELVKTQGTVHFAP